MAWMLDSSIVKQTWTIVNFFRIGSFILSQSSFFKTEVLVSSFYSGMMIFFIKSTGIICKTHTNGSQQAYIESITQFAQHTSDKVLANMWGHCMLLCLQTCIMFCFSTIRKNKYFPLSGTQCQQCSVIMYT